jgi:hypothetical protein
VIQEPVLPPLVGEHPEPDPRPREVAEAAGHEPQGGVGGKELYLALEAARVGYVVCVHAGDERRTTVIEPMVQGRHEPAPPVGDYPYPSVPPASLGQDRRRGIGGAVVHRHELPVGEALTVE